MKLDHIIENFLKKTNRKTKSIKMSLFFNLN